ncbi:hypothetical protein ACN6KF_000555 [Labrys sp. La1]|uniref:hypothetical protein n=1 Tax=Labrys sp. La1 TaxID=3404917 RepID=UPI003EB98C56
MAMQTWSEGNGEGCPAPNLHFKCNDSRHHLHHIMRCRLLLNTAMSIQPTSRPTSATSVVAGLARLATSLTFISPAPALAQTIACKIEAAWIIDEHGEGIFRLTKLIGTSLTAAMDGQTATLTVESPVAKIGTLKCRPPEKTTDELFCKGTTADGRTDTFHTMGGRKEVFRTTWFGNQAIVMACPYD